MAASSRGQPDEELPARDEQGLTARALLGWMDLDEAIRFLTEECAFSTPFTYRRAKEMWESRKAVVEALPREEPVSQATLPLSAADLKAARKFRTRHPDADYIVDFVRLNPMDLVIHQLWISTTVADGYRNMVTPDKWLQTALLDPPSHPRFNWRRENNTIVFDLPHPEFVLAGPWQPDGQMRVVEPKGFITVAFHANRALLLSGYHRTFACAQYALEAPNAPHGVLFGVANHLESLGSQADDVTRMMGGPRPPRMGDLFDDRLFVPVTLRRRRYQMRIQCEVTEIPEEEARTAEPAESGTAALHGMDRKPDARWDAQGIFADALRLHREGRIEDAVALYERAVFLKPDWAEAHSNLGVALAELGRVNEAVDHCERACAIYPDHVNARNNLGIALAAQRRFDEAAAQHKRVLAMSPTHAEAHVNLGNVSKFQGKFDDALAHYGRAIAIRPDYAEAHFNRSDIATFHPGDTDLGALETLAARQGVPANEATFVHFALAKALEDSGDYARALEHLHKGNALKRSQITYDETSVDELFRSISTVFDSRLFERFHGEGDPSPSPIFVLGMPRSGSTLIEQILSSHPEVYGAGEVPDLDIAAGSWLNSGHRPKRYPECIDAVDGVTLRRIGQSYLSRRQALADGKARIVDKLPGNFLNIGLIRLILPNARIIHTVRDPIDTCVSCYSKLFVFGQTFSYELGELGRYFRRYSELMNRWHSVLPDDAILDVSYEAVVNDLEGQARRLIDYCGLPWDDRCIAFHQNSRPVRTASAVQIRNPLFRSSLQRWRRYEGGIAPLLHELRDIGGASTAGAEDRPLALAAR